MIANILWLIAFIAAIALLESWQRKRQRRRLPAPLRQLNR